MRNDERWSWWRWLRSARRVRHDAGLRQEPGSKAATIRRQVPRVLLLVLVLVSLIGATGVWGRYLTLRHGSPFKYRVARVERGPLTTVVSASGTLNAVITVQVGTQVSGQVKQLFADFNTVVRMGQVIARLDPELFETRVSQARADLDTTEATVGNQEAQIERAHSDVENARAALVEGQAQTARAQVALRDARLDLDRKNELSRQELIAKSERDTAQTTHDAAAAQLRAAQARERALSASIRSAEAQLRVTKAMLHAARAQVKQKQAALQQALVDLAHTTIRAPVDGVVISRSVDVGQTVAASLQAPTLFTIAEDLTKMQVETAVPEADIGRIRLGDRVTFTVDAFPADLFAGTVRQIRKAPQILQNVVTYTVVLAVANPDGKLLPGMTANVKVVVAERANALKMPTAALRFRPTSGDAEMGASGASKPLASASTNRLRAPALPAPSGPGGGSEGAVEAPEIKSRVWVLGPDGKAKPIALTLGISDGTWAEVLAGDVREGQEVLVGFVGARTAPSRSAGAASREPRLRL